MKDREVVWDRDILIPGEPPLSSASHSIRISFTWFSEKPWSQEAWSNVEMLGGPDPSATKGEMTSRPRLTVPIAGCDLYGTHELAAAMARFPKSHQLCGCWEHLSLRPAHAQPCPYAPSSHPVSNE